MRQGEKNEIAKQVFRDGFCCRYADNLLRSGSASHANGGTGRADRNHSRGGTNRHDRIGSANRDHRGRGGQLPSPG
jgi:hypothetical protein